MCRRVVHVCLVVVADCRSFLLSSMSVLASGLTCLFLFNPTLGDDDTEHRKILYFHPQSMHLNRQKDYVGLTEGLIAFTK